MGARERNSPSQDCTCAGLGLGSVLRDSNTSEKATPTHHTGHTDAAPKDYTDELDGRLGVPDLSVLQELFIQVRSKYSEDIEDAIHCPRNYRLRCICPGASDRCQGICEIRSADHCAESRARDRWNRSAGERAS